MSFKNEPFGDRRTIDRRGHSSIDHAAAVVVHPPSRRLLAVQLTLD